MDAYVYVAGTMDGPKKVGTSRRPDDRYKGVKLIVPCRPILLGEVAMPYSIAYAVEQATHRMLWESALGHEWFAVDLAEALWSIDQATYLVTDTISEWSEASQATPGETWRYVARSLMQGRPAASAKKAGGSKPKYPPEVYLEAAKLGMQAGAKKLDMSLSGFIKAVEREQARAKGKGAAA